MTQDETRRFVLLDRDGVINEAVRDGYVTSEDGLRLVPGAAEAIARLNRNGFTVIVVSNQQCVGKGIMSQQDLDRITQALRDLVQTASGGHIDDFFYCPHLASDECTCRKPKPGLLFMARDKYGFDLTGTFFVGDSFSDMATAEAAGCPFIFVMSGLDAGRFESGEGQTGRSTYTAADLPDAVTWLLSAAAGDAGSRPCS
jgi:D-glycero-D-manno-heptose 1,7-bisphosphate phosphatase